MKSNIPFYGLEKQVLDALSQEGDVYLVGGIIRDLFVFGKVDYHDVDVEIHHISPHRIKEILMQFGHISLVGESFGIYKLDTLPHFDFAMPRKEVKSGHGHRDFDVIVDPDIDLKDACLRRDITINALMYHYPDGQIIDFFNGIDDINHRMIKMIDEKRFQDDPLRVLRVAQFASRLEFKIDHQTQKLCQKMVAKKMLDHLSYQRVFEEYNKLLMSYKPSIGLKFLLKIKGLYQPLMVLKDCKQRLDYHPEGDVMSHTLLVVDLAALCRKSTSNPLGFMWSALLHDIGKPLVTTEDGRAPGHHQSGVDVFEAYFQNRIPGHQLKKYIKTMIFYHMHIVNMARNNAANDRYLSLLKGIDGIVDLDDLILLSKCDKLGRLDNRPETIGMIDRYIDKKVKRFGKVALKPLITGKDLLDFGIEGKMFKELLDYGYDLQMKGHEKHDIMHLIKEKLNGTR